MDTLFNARYPFSKSARKMGESLSLRFDPGILEKGKRRAEDAVLKKKIATIAGPFGLEDELASYVIARMIVSQIGSRQAIESYAIAEAKRASSYLKSDTDENLAAIAAEFGLPFGFQIEFQKYLKFAPRAPEYKLVNRELRNGKVFLSKNELIRVLEEAIRLQILESLPLKIAEVPVPIKKAAGEIRALMPRPDVKTISGEKPPCIEKLIENLAKGENLSHSARWILAIYLMKTGMSEEEIVKLFSTTPDYDERVTKYQVQYIKRKGYSMPSCQLIDSNGLCIYPCGIRSPLSYKGKRFNKFEEKR